jgi:hypothetical protein
MPYCIGMVVSMLALIYVLLAASMRTHVLLRKRGVAAPLCRVKEPGPDPHYIQNQNL